MESMFHNCVSEFDLNFFEQTTNVNQATPLKPCLEAQQLGVARLKRKVKSLSQVVHRAKHIDEVLLVLEKELLETEQELKETKTLLAEKIEENKIIYEERNTYYNQVTENSIEIQKLREQLEKVKDKDYDTKLKDRIISGYSDQVNALQKELEDLMSNKKQNQKKSTYVLKQAKSGKVLVEKKLIRILKVYVIPTIKKRDRWLDTIIKKYLPDEHKDDKEESNDKIEKSEAISEKLNDTIIDDEEPPTQAILQRNTSVDYDYVESVDTGRGSSLAFSDGEKSFNSPDYYMDASPPCNVSNICNKCNIPKVDALTSPISPERSDSAINLYKKCVVSKKDACTSPIPSSRFDIATNTSEVSIEVNTPRKDFISNSEESNLNIESTLITEIIYNKETASDNNDIKSEHTGSSNKRSFSSQTKLQDFTFSTDDEDDAIVSNESGVVSPVDELCTEPPVPVDEVLTSPIPSSRFDIATNTSEVSIEVNTPRKEFISNSEESNLNIDSTLITEITYNKETASDNNDIKSEHTGSSNKKSFSSQTKLQDFTFSTDDEDDAIVSNESGVVIPVDELCTEPPVPVDEVLTSSQTTSSKDASTTGIKLFNKTGFNADEYDDSLKNISRDKNHVDELPVISPHSIEDASTSQSEKENISTPVKQQDDMKSDTNEEGMHDANQIKSRIFSPIDFNDSESSSTITTRNQPPTTSIKSTHTIYNSNPNTSRKSLQELECLELNNSKNYSNDVGMDDEIRRILKKMQLRHKMITPIPTTPLQRKSQSPQLSVEDRFTTQQEQVIPKTLCDQMDLFRAQFEDVFTSYVKIKSQYIEQIPRHSPRGDLNEVLLRNLLHVPNKNHEKHSYNTFELPSHNAYTASNNRPQPNVAELNSDSMMCLTETNENERSACHNCTTLEENTVSAYQIPYVENDKPQYGEVCQPNKELPKVNNTLPNSSLLNAKKSDSVFFVNDNCYEVTHENTHGSHVNDIENNNNIFSSIPSTSNNTTLSEIKSRSSIVYEERDVSEDDENIRLSDLVHSLKGHNENPGKRLRNRKGKKEKITKLETFRLKMLPKGKIKNDDTKNVRKLRSRPLINAINTVPKKKVKEFDTAASLNDKSVYEKAVAAFRDLKVVVKDCQLSINNQNTSKIGGAKMNCENEHDISYNTQPPISSNIIKNKRKLSENHTHNPNYRSGVVDEKKDKRTSISLEEEMRNKSPKIIKQKENNIAPLKLSCEISDKEILSIKRTHEVLSSSNETKEPKRMRRSISDHQNSNQNCKCRVGVVVPDSPRNLRSSSYVKPKIENGIITESCGRLRSKSDQVKLDTNTDIISLKRKSRLASKTTGLGSEFTQEGQNSSIISHIISPKEGNRAVFYNEDIQDQTKHINKLGENACPLGRKSRIARISTRTGAKNVQDKLNSSTVSDISREQNNRAVSYEDLGLFSNESTLDDTVNKNECKNPSPLERKSRPARKSTQKESKNMQEKLNSSTASGTSQEQNNRAVSYAHLSSLSNEVTQDETVDKNNFDIYKNTSTSLGRKPRIARQSTHKESDNVKDNLNSSSASDTSREQNSRTVSYGDISSLSNEGMEDETVTSTPLGRKTRIARQSTQTQCKNVQDRPNSSTASDISREQNSRTLSYDDLSLFSNEDNQDRPVENKRPKSKINSILTREQKIDKNNLETDSTSFETKSKLYNQSEHRISGSNQHLQSSNVPNILEKNNGSAISYADLNLFSDEDSQDQSTTDRYRKDSLLCSMIQKYGLKKIKFVAKQPPESKVKDICQKLETSLSEILEVPHDECLRSMKKLVLEIRGWNVKHFVHGFIKYLKNPERKIELYNKSICPPFPPMTKKEQVLLYIFDELQKSYDYRNIVQKILINIEYTLFALNKTAETYDVIETMAHFYALLCRSYQKISQLRLFVIDAMYCLQLRSVILVQQCLEVWMSVLPLGHMGLAKCPLVTCLVYLLHFYKCEDKFNRVQDIRNTLRWKYNYEMADWNENKILEVFKTAIIEIRDSPMERKTLRLSLLILAKRHGAKWCHTNIVKNMLQPLIKDSSTTDRARRFCISLLGPLLKPYPSNMKVHYEMMIDYLMDMLNGKNSPKMQEAIISSLIYVDKNNNRLHQYLAKWKPNQVSPDFQLIFKDYVRSKTINVWKKNLSWDIF